jgi:ATP-dependent exoDNAse (exonuclease V) alpha subunit
MAIYFLNMKTFGRSNGSSATSAIAYRAGERIRDERTGRVYDHRDRPGVLHTEIVLPSKLADADMSWARDRSSLWNAVEAAENRSNSRVAREFLVALPAELSPRQRVELVRGFSQELADRHSFAVDFAVHAPRTDPRNYHAHLLTSTREINTSGFGAKTGLEVSDTQRMYRGLQPFYDEFLATRERWASLANSALREAQVDSRIDHRSFADQGLDREPRPYLPRAVYEMERRGERNELALRLRGEHEARVRARVERARAAVHAPEQATGHASEYAKEHAPEQGKEHAPEQAKLHAPEYAKEHAPEYAKEHAPEQARPQTLDEIRRQAVENWLKMRRANAEAAPAPASSRGRDNDVSL